jgi:hypothetical protein
MSLRKDIWRSAIVAAPIAEILARGGPEGLPTTWLPEMPPFQFLADPFGLWRDGILHVFVETYDYRIRIGAIELLRYDASLMLIDRAMVLAEPWHLSYPIVWEAEGETWMLPEAHRSNKLTLYRADPFPSRWVPATVIELDRVAVDATPLFHEGRWWLLYAASDDEAHKTGALFASYADRLAGPWTPHPRNPVRLGADSTRPGGTAVTIGGVPVLPVQDCTETYGGAIRALRIDTLTPTEFESSVGNGLAAPASAVPYIEGWHTLSAAGDVTLIDCKRTVLTPRGLAIEARRELGKLGRKLRGR